MQKCDAVTLRLLCGLSGSDHGDVYDVYHITMV